MEFKVPGPGGSKSFEFDEFSVDCEWNPRFFVEPKSAIKQRKNSKTNEIITFFENFMMIMY